MREGIESAGSGIRPFSSADLESVESRKWLATLWAGEPATVRRTSGDIESNWYVKSIGEMGIEVGREEGGQNLSKTIPLEEFLERNPVLAAKLTG